MHFSTKIKKFFEGMRVYENLKEDEKIIHVPFALNFTLTIVTIVEQLQQFLVDVKNKVCREIPDIDFELMTDIDKIMPPVSRFGGGNRAAKKQTVIDKLKAFFERFFGIGSNEFVKDE